MNFFFLYDIFTSRLNRISFIKFLIWLLLNVIREETWSNERQIECSIFHSINPIIRWFLNLSKVIHCREGCHWTSGKKNLKKLNYSTKISIQNSPARVIKFQMTFILNYLSQLFFNYRMLLRFSWFS